MSGRGDREAADAFWSRPDIVERFAGNPPDRRLVRILEAEDPSALRVLDLGCAGGRNAAYLAGVGADVHAVDRSRAMVEHTRARLAGLVGREAALMRVRRMDMDDLSAFADGWFDLVVALGILQSARSATEWQRALSEVVRVTRGGGCVLVANFTPDSRPEGRPLVRAGADPDVWLWREGMPMHLVDQDRLDEAFARHGARPLEPTETVHVEVEGGFRMTANALYVRM